MNACNNVKNCILNDTCLPVNVESCIALQELLNEDEIEINPLGIFLHELSSDFISYITPDLVKVNFGANIQQLMIKMLNLIRDTENDDVSNVIQRLIYVYEDEISLFAVEIMQHLVNIYFFTLKIFMSLKRGNKLFYFLLITIK